MFEITNMVYDLEERTLEFGKRIIRMCKALPKNDISRTLTAQVIRSGTSVGANYREANEGISKKDFLHRIRIARKECKETTYWLELIMEANPELSQKMQSLRSESIELRKILSAILNNSASKFDT